MVLSGLGIKPEDRKRLIDEVQVILNSAASVNFMEPLHDAFQINYFGALRVQDLAQECQRLICMVQVSTCFVNSNQPVGSVIPEGLLKTRVDPEAYVDKILAMNP